jgi:enamine deaminase RidA (YjgF/YER057c/UK114 family)
MIEAAQRDAKGDRRTVLQPPGWPKPRGYSNGMMAEGRVVLTGGVVGWDTDGNFPDSFPEQARLAFANIRAILAEGGADPHHILRLTWYVTDVEEYLASLKDLGRAYRGIFGDHYPAMAVVGVVRLVEPKAKVEIEATAVVPSVTASALPPA